MLSELQEAARPAASALAQAVGQLQRQANAEAPSIDPIYAQLRDQSRFWIQRVAVPLIMVIGLFGNLITVVIMTRRRMRSTTNLYLAALAFVDMLYLVLTFILGLSHYPNMAERKYYLYWRLRPLLMLLADACSNTSVWLTVTFTMERFIAVKYPMKGKVWCTEARAKKLIGCVFAVALMFALPVPFEWQVIERQVKRSSLSAASPAPNSSSLMIVGEEVEIAAGGAQTEDSVIMLALDNTEFGRDETYKTIYYRLTAILFYFLPLISVTLFNGFLIHSVHQSRKERNRMTIRRHEPTQASGLGHPNEPSSLAGAAQRTRSLKGDRKEEKNQHSGDSTSGPVALSGTTKCNSATAKTLALLSKKSCSSAEIYDNQAASDVDEETTRRAKTNGISELGASSNEIKICVDLYNDNNGPAREQLSPAQRGGCDKGGQRMVKGVPDSRPTIEASRQQQQQQQDGQPGPQPDDSSSLVVVKSTITSSAPARTEMQVDLGRAERGVNLDQAAKSKRSCQKSTGRGDNDTRNSNANGHTSLNSTAESRAYCGRANLVTKATGLLSGKVGCHRGTRFVPQAASHCRPIGSVHLNESLQNSTSSTSSVCSLASPSSGATKQVASVNALVITPGPVIAASSQERRITIMLIAVVLLFLVCQIPSAAMLLYTSVHQTKPNTNEHAVLLALGNIFNFLMAINAAGNFILYSFLSKKYRRTFVILFCSCFKSQNKKLNSSGPISVSAHSRQQSISRSSNHQSMKARQTTLGPNKQTSGPPISSESTMKRNMGDNVRFKQQYITPVNNGDKMDDGNLIQNLGKNERPRCDTLV